MRKYVWILVIVTIGTVGWIVRSHYVLDSQKLDCAIKAELPPGTPKAKVMRFVQGKKPLAWDDLGTHLKARISGRAENLIYRKDVVLDFQFDSDNKLVSVTKNEYLTFL